MRKYKRPSISVLNKSIQDEKDLEMIGAGLQEVSITKPATAGKRKQRTANSVLEEIYALQNDISTNSRVVGGIPHKKIVVKKLTPIPTAGLLNTHSVDL